MKRFFKGLQRIKWENIALVLMIGVSIYSVLEHIRLNGFYDLLIVEIAIYAIACIGIKYLIRDIRVNPENWLVDK